MATRKPKGAWTYEDLLLLPDDGKRFEILDGELYEMPSPLTEHQLAIGQLYMRFAAAASDLGGLVLLSPTMSSYREPTPSCRTWSWLGPSGAAW